LKPEKKTAIPLEITKREGERAEDLIVNAKRTLCHAWSRFVDDQNAT
jgi:hypothetical protein